MTLQTKERPLGETLDYSENKTVAVNIDRDNVIRRIAMLFQIVVATTTTAGATIIEGDILNLVKKVTLVMDADDNKISIDLTKWLIVENIEKGTLPQRDTFAIPGTGVTSTFYVLVNADFAQARQQISDITALLDAPNKSSLKLKVEWGALADVIVTANDTTIDSTTKCNITLTEVFDDESPEKNAEFASRGFFDIRESIDQYDITKAYTNFQTSVLQQQIEPVPANILANLLLAKEDITSVSGTPVRANDVLTDIRVQNIKGQGENILEGSFLQLHYANKAEYSLESLFTGAVYFDWIDQRRGGLNNFVAEALKWKFLANAPVATETDAIEVYTKYIAGVAQ